MAGACSPAESLSPTAISRTVGSSPPRSRRRRLTRVRGLHDALALANAVPFALTAGCYGDDSETGEFLDRIEDGVTYVNRPQGATTGAWLGYQPCGGWKGSGTTGKAIGSRYYLPLYLREQSQTVVE